MSILTASTSTTSPLPLVSLPSSSPTPVRFLDITPHALAEALTLLDGELYGKVTASDCIGWLIGVQDNNGLSSFIAENDRLSYWVKASILNPDHHFQRSERRKYFLCVAEVSYIYFKHIHCVGLI